MSNIVKVGIIGSGERSASHAMAYRALDNVEIVAFCDIIEERATMRAKEFGAKLVYTDYRALAKDKVVDVVSVCSSNETHAEIAIAAAERGIHVLCEKPMGQSLKECDDMILAAEKNGVKLACVFQSRFFPRTQWIKELIDTKQMGDMVLAKGYGWTIHVWDLVLFVMGDPVSVSAEWAGAQVVHRNPLVALVRFASGHTGLMQASFQFYEPGITEKRNCFSFLGDKLTANFSLWGDELIFLSEDKKCLNGMEVRRKERFGNHPLIVSGVPEIPDFIDALVYHREPAIPGREGRKAIE
ncbi:MAG: Gfo/Idh/MocA family oxidoreductase, partial [Candidatus Omnitrophota bacterium]|nr:Gfo/Idh/MocA family oxidoreductase [Candidatus Omnitrophota bacterium]